MPFAATSPWKEEIAAFRAQKSNPIFESDEEGSDVDTNPMEQNGKHFRVKTMKRKQGLHKNHSVDELFNTIDSADAKDNVVTKFEFLEWARENKPAHGPFASLAALQTAFGLDKAVRVTREGFQAAFDGHRELNVDMFSAPKKIEAKKIGKLSTAFGGLESALEKSAPDAKELEEMIAHITSGDEDFVELRIVNNGYLITMPDEERALVYKRIIDACSKSTTVIDITIINSGITDEIAVLFANMLMKNGTIVEVDFEQGDLRDPAFLAFADVLMGTTTLKRFRAMFQQDQTVPTAIIEKIVDAVETNGVTTTCGVQMRDKSMGIRLNRALAKNDALLRKRVNDEYLAKARPNEKLSPVQQIIDGLPSSTAASLDLSNNAMFMEMPKHWISEILSARLAANKSITTLNLAGLHLTDEFALQFAEEVLSADTALVTVDLSRNEISSAGVLAIAEKIAATSIKNLKLNEQRKGFTTILLSSDAEVAMATACDVSDTLTRVSVDWRSANNRKNAERALQTNIREARFKKLGSGAPGR